MSGKGKGKPYGKAADACGEVRVPSLVTRMQKLEDEIFDLRKQIGIQQSQINEMNQLTQGTCELLLVFNGLREKMNAATLRFLAEGNPDLVELKS